MLLYALTIFTSAFLLFEVEPLIAKIILPWFGGSAAVWTTCLLFFQVFVLVGYSYACWLIKGLHPKMQTRIHILMVAATLLVLPIIPKIGWKPLDPESPTFRVLGLLTATVGLPFFALSSTGPLLQAWYAEDHKGATPYWLFSLSNGGSMLALLSYPTLVEPFFSTRHQAHGWSLAYAGFAVLSVASTLRHRSRPLAQDAAESQTEPQPKPRSSSQALWVALTACASTLLLAVTSHLSQKVAAIPFLWVLPLSLYLLSFILCFAGNGRYRRYLFLPLVMVALGVMDGVLSGRFEKPGPALSIFVFSAGLFICCMVCHGELARLRPHPAHLTSFYLMVSAGGALGGIFVGLLAPHLFPAFFELPIGILGCALLAVAVLYYDPFSVVHKRRWRLVGVPLVAFVLVLIIDLTVHVRRELREVRVTARNFYGVLQVMDLDKSDAEVAVRQLKNGAITHGLQFLDPDRRDQPTAYYGPHSGVALALNEAQKRGALRVGVIGLGAGTMASYGRPGDHYVFYEINPLVIALAQSQFTFLRDSKAEVDIIPGDARLSLEREPPQGFDLLAVDAFSGDSIPVHLLTREAFLLYFCHLKPGGVLAVHISNRYVDLRGVVQRAAESLGKQAIVIDNDKDEDNEIFVAWWVLVSGRREFFDDNDIKEAHTPLKGPRNLRMWTDDYSDLIRALK